jgi:hypothetical protein
VEWWDTAVEEPVEDYRPSEPAAYWDDWRPSALPMEDEPEPAESGWWNYRAGERETYQTTTTTEEERTPTVWEALGVQRASERDSYITETVESNRGASAPASSNDSGLLNAIGRGFAATLSAFTAYTNATRDPQASLGYAYGSPWNLYRAGERSTAYVKTGNGVSGVLSSLPSALGRWASSLMPSSSSGRWTMLLPLAVLGVVGVVLFSRRGL